MKNKKNRKLLFQVSVIILPVFIAMIAAIGVAMYNSTVNGFLDAQKAHMEYLLKNELGVQDYIDQDELEWYLTEWTEKPENLYKEYPEFFDEQYWEYYSDEDSFSAAWLKRLPEEFKAYCAKLQYENFNAYLNYTFDINTYDGFILMVISESKKGMVLYDYNRDRNGKKAGEYYELDLDEHAECSEGFGIH